MCGISLIVSENSDLCNSFFLKKISDKIAHRGPDNYGFFINEEVAIGHRRLSIIDIGNSSNQPMLSEDEHVILSFNGEIYNYIEVRSILESKGISFKTNGDVEVFLKAYLVWGTNCFKEFNGMWAAIIYDKRSKKVILCRDRFGIKPLVFFKNKRELFAGSEPKQLLELPYSFNQNRTIVSDYLNFGSLNNSVQTFWKEIEELPAGSYLEYCLVSRTSFQQKWYFLELNESHEFSYNTSVKLFREKFLNALELICRSDVPIGTLLSGGLDSSAILIGLKVLGKLDKVDTTISCCFPNSRMDETPFINMMNITAGVRSIKIFPLQEKLDFGAVHNDLIQFQDQPVTTPSHLSEYFVFKKIQEEGIKVVLGGQGADEYLGGYKDYPYLFSSNLLKTKEWVLFTRFVFQRAKIEGVRFDVLLRIYLNNYFKSTSQAWLPRVNTKLNIIDEGQADWISLKEFSKRQLESTSIPYQLHSEDRNSMMFSIESRQPFLDYNVVEFGYNLPLTNMFKGGWSKSILRDAFPELPDTVRWRKQKLGFPFPIEDFINQSSQEISASIFDNTSIFNGYFSDDFSKKILAKNLNELKAVNHNLLFRLYSFATWNKCANL